MKKGQIKTSGEMGGWEDAVKSCSYREIERDWNKIPSNDYLALHKIKHDPRVMTVQTFPNTIAILLHKKGLLFFSDSFTGHEHRINDVHEQTNARDFSTRSDQGSVMVEYLIDLLKYGPHMHRYHGICWVYCGCHICHPRQFSGGVIADVTSQLL